MIFKLLLALLLFAPAQAELKVVATTPDIAWLVQRVGGKNVSVKSLAKSGDNYHFLDARPDFILAVNKADLVCRVGADLEIGWLPKILDRAGNKKVMNGGEGDCDLSRAVSIEKPTHKIDRSMGDVHAAGNPHFWLSPFEMAKAAGEVEKRLGAIDPAKAAEYSANRAALEKELNALAVKIKEKLKTYAGKKAFEYHKDFYYYFGAYGMESLGSIEEIPGVAPSAARLGKVALEAKQKGASFALALEHHPAAVLAKFSEISGVPVVKLPPSLVNPQEANAYSAWQELMADRILKAN